MKANGIASSPVEGIPVKAVQVLPAYDIIAPFIHINQLVARFEQSQAMEVAPTTALLDSVV
jgi:hypothetical protein